MSLNALSSLPADIHPASPASHEPKAGTSDEIPFEDVLNQTKAHKRASDEEGLDLASQAAGQFQAQAPASTDNPTGIQWVSPDGSRQPGCVPAAAPALPDASQTAALMNGTAQVTDLSGQAACPAPAAETTGEETAGQPQPAAAALPDGDGAPTLAAALLDPPIENGTAAAQPPAVETTPDAIQEMMDPLKRAAGQSYATTVKTVGSQDAPSASALPHSPQTSAPSPVTESPAKTAAHPSSERAVPVKKDADSPQVDKTNPALQPADTAFAVDKTGSKPAAEVGTDVIRAADPRGRELVNQVARHVEMTVTEGRSSLRVQLTPAELGRIDLRVSTGPQGLAISLVADRASTNEALARQLDQLRQTLSDAGIQFTELNVGQQGYGAQQRANQQFVPEMPAGGGAAPRKEEPHAETGSRLIKDAHSSIDRRV